MAVLVSVVSALYTETASSSNSSDWSAASDSDTGWVESGDTVKTGTESEDDSSDCMDTSKSNFRSEGRAIPPGMVTWVGDAIYSISSFPIPN